MSEAPSHVLVIANGTLGGAEMLDCVARLNTPVGNASFYLLVPAAPTGESAWDSGEYRAHAGTKEAERRLQHGVELISGLGAAVDGEVGEADPIDAVKALLDRKMSFDQIILSTFTARLSRWLRLDVPHRLARIADVPIEHIESETASSVD